MRPHRVLGHGHRGPLRREYDPRELDGPPPDVGAAVPHLDSQPGGLIPQHLLCKRAREGVGLFPLGECREKGACRCCLSASIALSACRIRTENIRDAMLVWDRLSGLLAIICHTWTIANSGTRWYVSRAKRAQLAGRSPGR